MRYILILFIGCIFTTTASAQNEDWETYMAAIKDKPSSVLVNMALIDRVPNKLFPYLLITGPKSNNCLSNGLPDNNEIAQLEQILTETDNFITGVTPKILAGTLTYNCERTNYYYVKDTTGLSVAIARMYSHSFNDYKYVFKIEEDPTWKIYRTFLYPNEDDLLWMQNNKIVTSLLEQGDSLTKQRDISFVLGFKDEADRKKFIDDMHVRGYKIDELDQVKGDEMPYQLKISRYDYVRNNIISTITAEVKEEAKKYQAQYNGWTSPLIK